MREVKVIHTKQHAIAAHARNKSLPHAKGLVLEYESVLVAEGKLVLVESSGSIVPLKLKKNDFVQGYAPIIISETEKIETGDWVYDIVNKMLLKIAEVDENRVKLEGEKTFRTSNNYRKILALPEELSPYHLIDIVKGKINDDDKVLVECISCVSPDGKSTIETLISMGGRLNPFISLHKADEKMYTKDDLHRIAELAWATGSAYGSDTGSADFEDWFKHNVK